MKTELLLQDWMRVTGKYSADEGLRTEMFKGLLTRYAETSRHYHNRTHIQQMLTDIIGYYGETIPDELFFATWFHDAIYNPLFNNNEAKSADLAVECLAKLSLPVEIISKVKSLIVKTANHLEAEADDENIKVFLDADLKILGVSEDAYQNYTTSVRKEFSLYPDLLFNRGRKKFLEKALTAPRIYRTEKFFAQYEQQARKNLTVELNVLNE